MNSDRFFYRPTWFFMPLWLGFLFINIIFICILILSSFLFEIPSSLILIFIAIVLTTNWFFFRFPEVDPTSSYKLEEGVLKKFSFFHKVPIAIATSDISSFEYRYLPKVPLVYKVIDKSNKNRFNIINSYGTKCLISEVRLAAPLVNQEYVYEEYPFIFFHKGLPAIYGCLFFLNTTLLWITNTLEYHAFTGMWFWYSLIPFGIFSLFTMKRKRAPAPSPMFRAIAFVTLLPFMIVFSVEAMGSFLNEKLDKSESYFVKCTFSHHSRRTISFDDCPTIELRGFPVDTKVGQSVLVILKKGYFRKPWIIGINIP